MNNCEYYKTEKDKVVFDEWHGSRDKITGDKTGFLEWCSHPDSPKRKDEFGPLPCKGNKDKCLIK